MSASADFSLHLSSAHFRLRLRVLIDVVWMVGQAIQPRILGEVRKKLEMVEGQETCKKRDDEDDPGRGRNRGRKIGS